MSHNPAEYMFRLTYCTIVLFCVRKRKTSFCISRNKRINFFVGGEGGISEAPLFLNTGRLVLKKKTVFLRGRVRWIWVWYGMFFACGIWCLADVSSVSPSSEQTTLVPNLLLWILFAFLKMQKSMQPNIPFDTQHWHWHWNYNICRHRFHSCLWMVKLLW